MNLHVLSIFHYKKFGIINPQSLILAVYSSSAIMRLNSTTMSLTQKLSTAFIGLTLFILCVTLLLARWSFERGFLDYVNALEQQRLQSLASALSLEYQQANNDWASLPSDTFEELSIHSFTKQGTKPRGPRHPPPHFDEAFDPFSPPPHFITPTSLYNQQGERLAGPQIAASPQPISVNVYSNQKIVGELRSTPRREFHSPQETAFSQHQARASIAIGLICLAMAALVSALLAKMLLAPVKRLLTGISELSKGNYSNPISEKRHDELGLLMSDLDNLGLQLESNRSARRRSLADISHELRTPITVLTGEIEAIKDGIRPLNMSQVNSIDNEVSRLRRLIEDLYLLSLSDIGGLEYHFETLKVSEHLEQIVESVTTRAKQSGLNITLSCSNNNEISADPIRLQQLLTNLVENALAYTAAPGDIDIQLRATASEVIICFNDTAPSIDSGALELLFEPLYRPDASRSRRTAGAGLGLAICKNIVNAHKGNITAKQSPLGGLKIEVRLPLIARENND
ncbi:ATP-binding protein [Agarivorans sp. DSG3-1]|uniref:ATP-binding protein n=1 Tax=Agarivorans sp. DSG3-1 TaxID=3342249 RepID=UPI00398E4CA7